MKIKKQDKPVLSFSSLLRLYYKLRQENFKARTITQDLFLASVLERNDDFITDEEFWMARDILEANAPEMFQLLYPKADSESKYTTASLRKFWKDVCYYCEFLIDDLKI
jgi:hypothetical protein